MSLDAMKLALDALEHEAQVGNDDAYRVEREALRAAIEQYDQTSLELCNECGWKAIIPGDGCLVCARQKAKPVAYADSRIHGWPDCFVMEPDPPHTVPLYTAPRQWQGLTDQEIWSDGSTMDLSEDGIRNFARAIEAKLREKNT